MIDVSRSGCRIQAGFRLRTGTETAIWIAGFEPLRAVIVWSDDESAGIRFLRQLHPSVVSHIVAAQANDDERDDVPTNLKARD